MSRNASGMVVRETPLGRCRYLDLVESAREGGRIEQRIIKNWAARSRSRPTAI